MLKKKNAPFGPEVPFELCFFIVDKAWSNLFLYFYEEDSCPLNSCPLNSTPTGPRAPLGAVAPEMKACKLDSRFKWCITHTHRHHFIYFKECHVCLFLFILILFIWLHWVLAAACGVLSPHRSAQEPLVSACKLSSGSLNRAGTRPHALGAQSLCPWTSQEVLTGIILPASHGMD